MELIVLAILSVATALNRYRFDIFSLGIRMEHFALLLACVILITHHLMHRHKLQFDRADALLISFLGVTLLSSSLNAPEFKESLKFFMIMCGNVVFYFVVRSVAVSERAITFSIVCLSVVGTLQAFLGIASWLSFPDKSWSVQLFKVSGIPGYNNLQCTYSPSGTLVEPNIFGSYEVAVALIAAVFLLRPARSPLMKIVFASSLFAVGLSLTRGAWLAALIGLIFLLILSSQKRRALAIVLSAAMLIFSGAYLASVHVIPCRYSAEGSKRLIPKEEATSFLSGLFSTAQNATSAPKEPGMPATQKPPATARVRDIGTTINRMSVYKDSLSEWKRHPILGNGANSYAQTHETHQKTPGWIPNILLMTIHDSGIFGLLLLLGWLFLILKEALAALKQGQNHLSLLLAFTALFFAYQFTSAFWLGFTWFYLALIRSSTFVFKQRALLPAGAN